MEYYLKNYIYDYTDNVLVFYSSIVSHLENFIRVLFQGPWSM